MSRKRIGSLAALAWRSCRAASPPRRSAVARAASSHTVMLQRIPLSPAATLTIRRGDRVTWLWRDNVEHNVDRSTASTRGPRNTAPTPSRFTHAGTFTYHCTIHGSEGMRGRIVVH